MEKEGRKRRNSKAEKEKKLKIIQAKLADLRSTGMDEWEEKKEASKAGRKQARK